MSVNIRVHVVRETDALGRVTTISNAGSVGLPTVLLTQTCNAADERTGLAATVHGGPDFTNTYQYDALGRLSRLQQAGPGVAPKRVDLAYNAADASLYEEMGYEVQRTGGSHDRGIDVIATRRTPVGFERIFIQCKRQQDPIGRPVVQQLWGVVSDDQTCTQGVLATSAAGFTREAYEFARDKRLTLIAGPELKEQCRAHGVAALR